MMLDKGVLVPHLPRVVSAEMDFAACVVFKHTIGDTDEARGIRQPACLHTYTGKSSVRLRGITYMVQDHAVYMHEVPMAQTFVPTAADFGKYLGPFISCTRVSICSYSPFVL